MTTALRILTLVAFGLFGGALPVAAGADHAVICGANGATRIVAYDFETGKPVEVEIAKPACQDCFGLTPILIPPPETAPRGAAVAARHDPAAETPMPRRSVIQPTARAPPLLIV